MIPIIVYCLCAATSALCAALLWRAFAASRHRLLLWSFLCFALLTANNIIVVLDVVWVDRDLQLLRNLTGFGGVALLLFGLIWETN